MNIQSFLYEELRKSYDEFEIEKIIKGYVPKKTTLRVNTIKSNIDEIKLELDKENIKYKSVSFYKDALIIEGSENDIKKLDIYKDGKIYLQSLSSMLPPLILNPKENDRILDMAAAPGGKTCQIASLTNNNCYITAVEKNKIRSDRLKYNLNMQGVKKYSVLNYDANNLDDLFSFDKILLDSPCSGSGTLFEGNNNISNNLINNIVKTQEQLLTKALKLLKNGGTLVYSTCSILKCENEDILSKVLKKFDTEIIPIDIDLDNATLLNTTIPGTITICPNEIYEGFFIALIKKN